MNFKISQWAIPLCLLVITFWTLSIDAQMSIGGLPLGLKSQKSTVDLPVFITDGIDLVTLAIEDEQDRLDKVPMRFGVPFKASIDMTNSGTWEDVDEGRIWRTRIHCPGAKSINLNYDEFYLPSGATFYIYAPNGEHVIGAFTELNNKSHRTFATGLVLSEEIILEYFEPSKAEGLGRISVSEIIYGYRAIGSLVQEKAFGDSQSCEVNVNCASGDNWQEHKKSVAMMSMGANGRFCTGALINNPQGNCEPLFLTAFHCLENDDWSFAPGDNVNWLFIFNYESESCNNPNSEPLISQNVQGAEIIAMGQTSDFALLRLAENPALAPNIPEGVYYAGWDRSNDVTGRTVAIHHPAGDIKKVSTDNQSPSAQGSWNSGTPNTHWEVRWNEGVTEGGSSGGPLFNVDGNIIGQLHGGSSFCSNPTAPEVYGKIFYSWESNGNDTSEQLEPWLDPDGDDISQLDGRPCGGIAFDIAIEVLSPQGNFCEGLITPVVRLTNNGYTTVNLVGIESLLDGESSKVDVYSGELSPFSTVVVPLKERLNSSGTHVISACLVNLDGNTEDDDPNNNCDGSSFNCVDVGIDDVYAANVNVYPNPTSGAFSIDGIEEEIIEVLLFDTTGKTYVLSFNGNDKVDLPAELASGLFYLGIKTSEHYLVKKLQVLR